MMYYSTKTYTHSAGLSCAFRQWRADSHCRFLHGYALSFKITFAAERLDDRNWVMDFGGLKDIKLWLEMMFDHKTLVAADDPQLDAFATLAQQDIIELIIVPATGCEAFAKLVYCYVEKWLLSKGMNSRVCVYSVEVHEHEGNSAIYSNH